MEVKAEAKHVKISPQKVRRVIGAIEDLGPTEALDHLEFMAQKAAQPLRKVIASAVANARHNHDLSGQSLRFKRLVANDGPTFKRWRPVARGRAHSILKRTSHIEVVLEGEEA